MPTPQEDRRIKAAALADPDAQPLTEADFARMTPVKLKLGRPPSDRPKVLMSMRYSPEVLEYFKKEGPGWQSRMDSVLRSYVRRRQSRTHRTS